MAVARRQRGSEVEVALVDLLLVPAACVVPPTWHRVGAVLELWFNEVTAHYAEFVLEPLSNAIRHTASGQMIRLRIAARPGGLLRIEVTDFDPNPAGYVVADEKYESGRGLFLIRVVAADFCWRPVADGKALWGQLAYGMRDDKEKPAR